MKSKFAFRAAMAALVVSTASMTAAFAQEKSAPVAKAEPVAKAQPLAKAEPTKASARKATPSVRPLSIVVDLLSKTRLEGTLTDKNILDMQTSFGTANIPLSEVAGIKFASADDASTTVVMLNGDSITGATDVKLITIETEWGEASVNGPNITSIMFVPNLAWNPDSGLNGKRWNLISTKKVEAPTPVNPPARSGNTNSNTNRSTVTGQNGNIQYGQPQPVYRNR